MDDDSEPIDLSWPSGWKDRLAYLIRAPIMFCMYYTAQDIKRPVSHMSRNNNNYYYYLISKSCYYFLEGL